MSIFLFPLEYIFAPHFFHLLHLLQVEDEFMPLSSFAGSAQRSPDPNNMPVLDPVEGDVTFTVEVRASDFPRHAYITTHVHRMHAYTHTYIHTYFPTVLALLSLFLSLYVPLHLRAENFKRLDNCRAANWAHGRSDHQRAAARRDIATIAHSFNGACCTHF